MAQIAGEVHAVLQEAKQHPGVQLEANSFPALPVDTASYIAHWEEIVKGVHRLADSLDTAAR